MMSFIFDLNIRSFKTCDMVWQLYYFYVPAGFSQHLFQIKHPYGETPMYHTLYIIEKSIYKFLSLSKHRGFISVFINCSFVIYGNENPAETVKIYFRLKIRRCVGSFLS